MVPVDFEFMENMKENATKQNCEIKAAKRLLKRIKHTYPRLNIILSGDALYACKSIIEQCETSHWKYIIREKEGRISSLFQEFQELKTGGYVETINKKIIKRSEVMIEQSYCYTNDMEYKKYKLNIVEINEKKE